MADKVALINLGCPKNLVDAEVMLGHLQAEGFELTADSDAADVVIVNTCGFLQDAAQESVNALLSAAEGKRHGKVRGVIAAGCMAQRYGDSAAEALPEVDGFLGVGQAQALPHVVREVLAGRRTSVLRGPAAGFEGYGLRLQSTPSHTAYLKVSEGCDRKCGFCVIPQIRGPMVSRSVDAVVREAQVLVAQGTRELVLIGQDPTRYGVDREDRPSLVDLLEQLNAIPDVRWIRVMYLFPDKGAPAVLEAISSLEKVCRYVDMPFQHAAPSVLRRMNRPGGAEEYHRLLQNVRAACPEIAIRSTFIVGYPGETEAEFGELLRFVREAELNWVGVFRYSPEEGSPAATMEGQVPKRVARERYHTLMSTQQEITAARLHRMVGSTVEVLVEQCEDGQGRGRLPGQAPEVDGETLLDLRLLPETLPGDFIRARITGAGDYDLRAEAVALLHRPPRRQPGLLHIGVLH